MAVTAPGDDLFGAGSTAADPNLLQRILGYTNPPPLDPDAAARAKALADAQAQFNAGSPLNINRQSMLGPNSPIANAAQIPPILPSAPSAAPSAAPFQQPAHPSTMRFPMWPTPPAPAPIAAPTAVASAPTPPARPVTPTPATAYPPAAAPAAAPVAGPGFSLIDRQNAPATLGQPARGYQTALDLSGLFGGGRPAAVNPADVPSSSATPMKGGALSKGGMKLPKDWGPFTEDQARGRSLKQRYG